MAHVDRGLYLEDFEIGKVYESCGRTITESDVVNFAGLSGDFNPLHMDEEFGKNNMFGKRVAHGMLGPVIMTGLSNQTGLFEGTTIAFLELSIKYTAPLCIGDTVHLEFSTTEVRHLSLIHISASFFPGPDGPFDLRLPAPPPHFVRTLLQIG